jgi:acyl-CoA thioesterase-2
MELKKLIDIIQLDTSDQVSFTGHSIDIGSKAVYGGQVLAQAMNAVTRTVPEDRFIHSIHPYFILPGNIQKPIEYKVDVIRDGRSFTTRRVVAYQDDKAIFILAASFQIKEKGLEHQIEPNNIIPPEALQPFSAFFKKFAEQFNFKPKGLFSEDSPIEFRMVENIDPINPGKRQPYRHVWFRAAGPLPDDPRLHQQLLAYASDFNLLISALLPHNLSFFTTPMKIASLDHAMWFHREFRMDDWLLYAIESPSASNARGFSQARIFNQSGSLIASVTQEGLIRIL